MQPVEKSIHGGGGYDSPREPDDSSRPMILSLADSLFRMFRENSDVVPVSRLKKQGHRSVTVLDWDRIQALIQKAVEEALARRGVDLSPQALDSVSQEARETFVRLVEQRDTYRESTRTLEAEREELRTNMSQLKSELESSKSLLAHEREHVVTTEEVAVGAEGMASFHSRLEAEMTRLLAGAEPGADIAAQAAALARRLLDEEQAKATEDAREEQRLRVAQLERRVGKLRKSLRDSETLVTRLRETKGVPGGVESIYREVQGLDPSEEKATEKAGLLEEIFKLNVELRDVIQDKSADVAETSTM